VDSNRKVTGDSKSEKMIGMSLRQKRGEIQGDAFFQGDLL
jgi:hypothetical protein